jgi:hypothetical protein
MILFILLFGEYIRIIALRGMSAMKKKNTKTFYNLETEFAEGFRNRLMERLPGINYEYINPDRTMIKIPAISTEFGDIKIYIDFREITVLFGNKHHTHFDIDFPHKDISDNNSKEIIDEVIEFIEEILNDKVFLKVKIIRDRIISSSIVYEDRINEPIESMWTLSGFLGSIFSNKTKNKPRTILYSWSGIVRDLE